MFTENSFCLILCRDDGTGTNERCSATNRENLLNDLEIGTDTQGILGNRKYSYHPSHVAAVARQPLSTTRPAEQAVSLMKFLTIILSNQSKCRVHESFLLFSWLW